MRVFLYEFVTGGGFLGAAWQHVPLSLQREGAAMLAALAADFAAVDGVEVSILRDGRCPDLCVPGVQVQIVHSCEEERRSFDELAGVCDLTLVIAPESENHLLHRCRQVVSAGGRLLGPSLDLVALASDKHATALHLAAAGVPVPQGVVVQPRDRHLPQISYPAVGKPRLGAGSQGVCFLPDRDAAREWQSRLTEPSRLERYCPGIAASVAFVCGPSGIYPLAPCRQHLGSDERFAYLGGSCPLPEPLACRAVELARRAVVALPGPQGYVGVDLVLGDAADGGEDVAIEVNPRVTTSYIGLRQAAAPCTNLAAAMLDVLGGRPPRLSFRPDPLQFGF